MSIPFWRVSQYGEADSRVKFFAHPDMDEFKRDVLVPKFHKITTEKPPESRKGEQDMESKLGADVRIERGILVVPRISRIISAQTYPACIYPLNDFTTSGKVLPTVYSSPPTNGRVLNKFHLPICFPSNGSNVKFRIKVKSRILISMMASLYPTQRLGPSMNVMIFGQTPGPDGSVGGVAPNHREGSKEREELPQSGPAMLRFSIGIWIWDQGWTCQKLTICPFRMWISLSFLPDLSLMGVASGITSSRLATRICDQYGRERRLTVFGMLGFIRSISFTTASRYGSTSI